MRTGLAGALLGLMIVAACNADRPGAGDSPIKPVVVYAEPEQEVRLLEVFSDFTSETQIPVNLQIADSESNLKNVIDNQGAPRADVLITSNVTDIWRAADEGALRPIAAKVFEGVPAVLKDPDGTWAPIRVRYAVIAVVEGASPVDEYGDLAASELRGKVCLSSSTLPVNRSLIAMLIEDIGLKPAERMVRAWVRNLAASPYATEQQLVDALKSGPCQYGVISSRDDIDGLSIVSPHPLYLDIDAIGVARHAEQAESAQALVEWMLESNTLPEPESSNGRNVGLAGWHDEDVRLLAERAGYR
ncbi:MAG: ABC transporter substrate-binding protein [Woeseiaceae bacterium]